MSVAVAIAIFVLVLVVRDDALVGVEETSLLCKGNKDVVDARKESGRTDCRAAAIEKADDNDEKEESQQTRKKAATALSDEEDVVGSNKKRDHSTLLNHALGRLYHTMCRQDAEDYSSVRRESYNWNARDLKKKLQKLPNEIAELEEREKNMIKESKLMGNTNAGVMEEAYRLLGVVPPEGC